MLYLSYLSTLVLKNPRKLFDSYLSNHAYPWVQGKTKIHLSPEPSMLGQK
jgi:hypothetical protein